MNILEQLAQAKKRGLPVDVATLKVLEVGETFEFAASQPLQVGDVVGIKLQRGAVYGRAEIVKNPHPCDYWALRIS